MMKKKNPNLNQFVERGYKISFRYIKESRKFIYYAIGIFLFFAFVGFFFPLPENFRGQILNYLIDLVKETEGYGVVEMIFFLLGNNSLLLL